MLLSNEDLAEAGPAQVARFADLADKAGFDVEVILTARDWAKQLPSEWQRFLKRRVTTDYETFLAEVRDRSGPEGERFWRRQDTLDICGRRGKGLDPARVHVISVPPASADSEAVYRLFGEVVGFDPSLLRMPSHDVNASFGYTEAEMLRQLNMTLGDRLGDFLKEYRPAMRRMLIDHVIARGASERIPLPPTHVGWVRDVSAERLAQVIERGYTLHGDHTLLVPEPDVGRPVPHVDDAAIVSAALRTLADFADRAVRGE